MRKKFIAGNWKMNTTRQETTLLLQAIHARTTRIEKTTMMVAPPFTNLQTAADLLTGTKIFLGGQNLHWEEKGAFTGEVSAAMLKDLKCAYVIIGHSERRQHFKETDPDVNRKVSAALRHGLLPIICVGETLDQREKGETLSVVDAQVRNGLVGFSSEQTSHFTIAYEPVWAIGSGRAATPRDAVNIHSKIRSVLAEMFGADAAQAIRIQYGGSVTAENIDSFIVEPEIDGALVGGASLKADSFAKIIEAAEKV
jgi:triosephosphate isomerase